MCGICSFANCAFIIIGKSEKQHNKKDQLSLILTSDIFIDVENG